MTQATRHVDERLGESSGEPLPAMSVTQRAEIEAEVREAKERSGQLYQELLRDAQACTRAMLSLPQLAAGEEWEATVTKSLEDLRSGRALLDQVGADRLIDPAMAGRMLVIRRGLIEEFNASSASELMLIDAAVIASANAARIEAMIGNTALLIEAEMFGQQLMRAKWRKTHGSGHEHINGLAVDEHITMLRDRLMPLAERFNRMARESLEALGRTHQVPSLNVERAEAVQVVLIHAGPSR